MGAVKISKDTGDIETLLSIADAACYFAKGNGGGSVLIYRFTDENVVQLGDETRWARAISQALENDRVELHCQHILGVSSENRNHTHYEILMRMRDH
jgi:predicted signal transduction protein with EAL and GGDEF domain